MPSSKSRSSSTRRGSGPARRDRARPPRLAGDLSLWLAAVIITAGVVHLNAFGNAFVFDDLNIIRDNPRIRDLGHLPRLFTEGYWGIWGNQGLYRPLAVVTYALNYAAGGLATAGYTAVNIALHMLVSGLVVLAAANLGASAAVAGGAGLLFAVHPIHTEAVTGFVGRAETLAAAFFLLAFLLDRRIAVTPRPRLARAGPALAYLCALLSKENAVTWLAAVAAADGLLPVRSGPAAPVSFRTRLRRDYPLYVAVTAVYLAARIAVVGVSAPPASPLNNPLIPRQPPTALGHVYGATFLESRMTAVAVLAEYGRLLVWPARLSCDYSLAALPVVHSAADRRFAAGLALVAAWAAGILVLKRRVPLAAYGLLFLGLTFSLSTNLPVRIGTICAERLLYLSSAGFVLAVASGGEALSRRRGAARTLCAVFAVVLVLAAARTWVRNRDWRDEHALWSSAVEAVPQSAKAQAEYGRVLLEASEAAAQRGDSSAALATRRQATTHLEQALAIYPESRHALNSLTKVALLDRDPAAAIALAERSATIDPGDALAMSNWGLALMARGEAEIRAAKNEVAAAGALDGSLAPTALRTFNEAIAKLDRALEIEPGHVIARYNRAVIYRYRLGRPDLALADFREVLARAPDHPNAAALRREIARLERRLAP